MSVFNYTLPSGSTFRMTAPTGTTQLQADQIFYSQVAAGAFVGYSPGQTLTSATETVTKFALSRLDRGTAGVDTQAIVAIVNNIPTVNLVSTAANGVSISQGLPNLTATPLVNPVGQADLVNVATGTLAPNPIGPLSSNQVQGILAQISNLVDQPATVMTDDKGVGQYGFSCVQLEQAGYVKPGTWQRFIFDPSPMTSVLSAAGIWTGKNGIKSVTDFLNNAGSQTDAQNYLLQTGYNSLVSSGTILPATAQSLTTSVGQIFSQSGLQTVSALGASIGTSLSVPSSVSSALSGTAVASLLSSPLTNISSISSGAVNAITNAVGNFTNTSGIISNLTNTAIGDVGALVSNAGRFGSAATAAWSQLSSGDVSSVLGGITGQASNIANNLLGSITGPAAGTFDLGSSLVNALPGDIGSSISNLTSNLDITGKAGQFATAFSDPAAALSNLGNFDISSLTNLGSGAVTNLLGSTGSIGSAVSGLLNGGGLSSVTGLLSGSGSLGSAAASLLSGSGSLGSAAASLLSGGGLSSVTSLLSGGGVGSLLGSFGGLSSLGALGSLGSLGGLFGGGGDSLVSSTQVAAGYSNTVDRGTLDVALTKIIGSTKVPTPLFDFPSINSISLNASADITAASNILQNLKSQGGALLSQIQQTATNAVSSTVQDITKQAGGVISDSLNNLIG